AVRTEELINYFKYQDPDPKTKNDIALRTEYITCPWNEQNQLLRVSARTMPIANADLPAANLVFLLDVSGSMSRANKLPLVKESLKMLTQNLRAKDKVAIVVYAGAAGLVLPPTSGKDPATIVAALDKLSSGGSTAGGAGIQLAYDVARKHFVQDGNNRIILATDGDFNVGASSQEDLLKLIEKERESGIYLTVLGFGTGNYQEGTMQELADLGNGNHGYIDSPAEAKKILVSEFGGTMYTVAKDVKLQLEFDPEVVASYRLIGYENRLLAKEDFDDDTKDAAEMGAGHNVTVLYELVPANKYRKADYLGYLRLRYKPNTGGPSKKESYPVASNHHTDEAASNDIRWAAAVAEFSMLLTDSKHKGAANWKHCLKMANNAIGKDTEGYRSEMITLIGKAEAIANVKKK
ncbi:MAG: von Willebrand factor type A domain-containing protein, partial [Lewinella sp.]